MIFRLILPITVLAILGTAHAQKGIFAESPRGEIGISSGYRQDRTQWTIAGPQENGSFFPNIISDLEWYDLDVFQIQLDGRWKITERLFLEGLGGYGWIYSGKNRDSDYAGNNRSREFSRSTADTDGYVYDLSIGIGYEIPITKTGVTLSPKIGFSYHKSRYEDTNGVQVVDRPALEDELDGLEYDGRPADLGPFSGLNSYYESSWYSPWFGLQLHIPVTTRLSLNVEGKYTYTHHDGDAFWNQRNLHFSNDADGHGFRFDTRLRYRINDKWFAQIAAYYSLHETGSGTQTDPGGDIHLNGVDWESWGISLGMGYYF